MNEVPNVKPLDWITLGPGGGKSAVVCSEPKLDCVEIVYLDNRDQPINEHAVWNDGSWEFKHSGPVGGYAKNSDRLAPYVSELLRGRNA